LTKFFLILIFEVLGINLLCVVDFQIIFRYLNYDYCFENLTRKLANRVRIHTAACASRCPPYIQAKFYHQHIIFLRQFKISARLEIQKISKIEYKGIKFRRKIRKEAWATSCQNRSE
jgi:hypothetical protein